MSDRFEVWARGEMRRLTDEAERLRLAASELENVLSRFLSSGSSSSTPTRTTAPASLAPSLKQGKRTSKNDVLLRAFEAAGPDGLDMDQLEQLARRENLNSDRHALRAYAWHQKQAGRLISLAPGRHAIAPKNEAADPAGMVEESAASDTTNDAVKRGEVEHEKIAD